MFEDLGAGAVSQVDALQLRWEIDPTSWDLRPNPNGDGYHTLTVEHGIGSEREEQYNAFYIYYDPNFAATGAYNDAAQRKLACRTDGGMLLGGVGTTAWDKTLETGTVLQARQNIRPADHVLDHSMRKANLQFRFGRDLASSGLIYKPRIGNPPGRQVAYLKFCVEFVMQTESNGVSVASRDMNSRELAVLMAIELDSNFDTTTAEILRFTTEPADPTLNGNEDTIEFGVTAMIRPPGAKALSRSVPTTLYKPGQAVSVCACADEYPLTAVGNFGFLSLSTENRDQTGTYNEPVVLINSQRNQQNGKTINMDALQVVIARRDSTGRSEFDAKLSGAGGVTNSMDPTSTSAVWRRDDFLERVHCRCWDCALDNAFFDLDFDRANNQKIVYVDGVIDLWIGPTNPANVRRLEHGSFRRVLQVDDGAEQETIQEEAFHTVITLEQVNDDAAAPRTSTTTLMVGAVLVGSVLLTLLSSSII